MATRWAVDRNPGRSSALTRLAKIDTSRVTERVRPRLRPRGLPPALERHCVWETKDPYEAAQFARDLLGSHRVLVTDDRPEDFDASFHAVRLRDITLGYLDYGASVDLEVACLPASFLIIMPMSGSSTVRSGGQVAHASTITGVIPRPNLPVLLQSQRATAHLIVRIDQHALLVHLGRLLGRHLDETLRFDLELDLASPTASRWNFAIQMLHAELFDPDSLLHHGVGAGQLEEFVMSSLLYAHPSNHSQSLTRPGQDVEHRATRAAKDFIERELAEPLTVATIAAAAGVSERTLQAAFHTELSTTPTAYVRDRRLDRARADLADAAATDSVSVTTIATRWGFGHLGRFAAEYKARFGESPSQTLRN